VPRSDDPRRRKPKLTGLGKGPRPVPRNSSDVAKTDRQETPGSTATGPSFAAASPREAAFQALELSRQKTRRLADAWQQVQTMAALSPVDRNLSRELAFGVARREITLDVLLQKLVSRPLSDIEPPLKTVLQLGVYQLIFAQQIPPHAAVHETVELAKKVGRLRWAGFVNGILRAASRLCTEDFAPTASARAVPVGDERGELRFRLLTEPVFPDPTTDFPGYFWRAYGFPEWLAARWVARWSPAELHRLGHWQRMPPPVFLRVNLLKTSREELLQTFHAATLQAVSEVLPEAIRVLSGGRIEDWPGYADGLFSVQDLTAMRAARRLAPASGSRVLDLCAAPGGKTCHLAELMKDAGEILAVDITPARLNRIVENASRLGLKSVHALLVSEDGHDLPRGPFDFILADVPCSNTGVIGRRPEVVRQLTLASIQELSRLQSELLSRAAQRLKPGGRLLYSTCSIEVEENELVIADFLQHHKDFQLIESELLLPGSPADGGYQALLERTT
jgi:16S rRNA (cytosine967-C5)-methyltransferase